MEKSYQAYQKKIVPYLDGSLAFEEREEFLAFVSTHPEFETQIKNKESEIDLLRSMIPTMNLSETTRETIESEMRASIFNLLKVKPQSTWERILMKMEDWLSR